MSVPVSMEDRRVIRDALAAIPQFLTPRERRAFVRMALEGYVDSGKIDRTLTEWLDWSGAAIVVAGGLVDLVGGHEVAPGILVLRVLAEAVEPMAGVEHGLGVRRVRERMGWMVRPASTATAGVGSVAEKQARGEYDVFICYHSEDREAVMGIVVGLRERGLLPWIDQDCLRPGFRWMPELERMIGSIPAAAVCIGESGRGPWQDEEIDALLRNLKGRNAPVIPVMLPGSRDERARLFLDSRTRVDFRKSDPDPMEQLVFGITGQNPRLGK